MIPFIRRGPIRPNYPAAILYGSMATLAVVAGVWLVRLV